MKSVLSVADGCSQNLTAEDNVVWSGSQDEEERSQLKMPNSKLKMSLKQRMARGTRVGVVRGRGECHPESAPDWRA